MIESIDTSSIIGMPAIVADKPAIMADKPVSSCLFV